MNKKNSMIQTNDSVNSITDQDLSAEMVELSDEALSQVCGGAKLSLSLNLRRRTCHGDQGAPGNRQGTRR
jgi:hypothetical protein